MDVFRLVGIGLGTAVLAVFIKDWRGEMAMQLSVVASVVMLLLVLPYIENMVRMLNDISGRIGMDSAYIRLIVKTMGIAYVAQFGSELCRDAGQSAIASKIEFGGKVIIVTLSMPLLYSFLGLVEKIAKFG